MITSTFETIHVDWANKTGYKNFISVALSVLDTNSSQIVTD